MTEKQKDCIYEVQELMLAINNIVKKHGLEDEFVACLAVGFVDMSSKFTDEFGDERANMSLLSSFSVSDDEELDDLLSYCVEAYNAQKEEEEKEKDPSKIDYWIDFGKRDGEDN